MRFLVLVKVPTELDKQIEAGVMPKAEDLAPMGAFNDTLSRDGILLAAEGLHATAKGARITFVDGKPVVTDGPFTESKEVIGGFWILQGRSKEEIVERMSRVPFAHGEHVEIRPIFEIADLGGA